LGHILTGGALFSNAWLTRGIAIGTAAALLASRSIAGLRRPRRPPNADAEDWARPRVPRAERWAFLGVVALGLVVWGSPVFRMLPLDHLGDTQLHMGWASQLLNGESTPSGPL